MKRVFTNWSLLFCTILISSVAVAQQGWPKTISAANGDRIKIYQPQPESYANNILKSRAAISLVESGKTDPVFGTYWSTAQTSGGGSGTVFIQSLEVTDVRFPSDLDDSKIDNIKSTLQSEVPKMNVRLAESDLQNALNATQEQAKLSSTISNTPPKIFYSNKAAILVLIDGEPKLQMNNDWGVEAVVNTPFTIVKTDGRFYLYGGKRWFVAPNATGPYSYISSVSPNLQNIQAAADKAAAETAAQSQSANADNADNNYSGNSDPSAATTQSNAIPQIIVSTEPAELVQSDGEPQFTPVEGTSLLYVKNSGNDIFMNVNSQQYYVLLAGRWYKANNMNSPWTYIPSNELPSDFAKIPEGSPKDNVLASVAGTDAAQEAVLDAQVPQTAKVDRKTATSTVNYDGNPEFENIQGTDMQYSLNSSNSVLRYRGRYYTVDNGVWFEASSENGPWVVATSRPDEVDRIPPSYPVYNMKYVYVYDVDPDYVWMGYTPGYLNTYVYGPTIVYGTGYHYRPWYRHNYYPRAYTWGFNMGYNPWYGWSVGWDFSFGWFNMGMGGSRWNYYHGGWWGPSAYRPACYYNPYRRTGYYGAGRTTFYQNNRTVIVNRRVYNNVYNNRRDVVTVNNRAWINNQNSNNRVFNNNNGNRGGNNNGYNNRMGDRGGRPGNGFNNNRPNYSNNNGYNNNNNNRVSPGFNNNNPGYANPGRPNRAYNPQSPGNNNNRVSPQYPNNRMNPQPGNNSNNQNNNNQAPPTRMQPNNYRLPQQQQQSRPQMQQQSQPSRPAPQQQQRVERPSNNGGGGGFRPSGGDRGNGGGNGGGRGGDHGRRG